MTNKDSRNFIAKEIQKHIVGPGFTQGAYVCADDCSDEILINRPQIVYTSGILFPHDPFPTDDKEEEDDDVEINNSNDAEVSSDESEENLLTEENNDENGSTAEITALEDTYHFNPNHCGLITSIDGSLSSVDVEINYGQYYVVEEKNIEKEIKVPLHRCTINQLKETFAYYDRYAQGILKSIGVHSVNEMFAVDEENNTISPKKLFKLNEVRADGKTYERYIRANDFPSILRNKVARVVCELTQNPTTEKKIDFSWNDFLKVLKEFDKIDELKQLLTNNGWSSFTSGFKYDEENQQVKITRGRFNVGEYRLPRYLYVDDPVKDFLLDKLLQFRFFKRKQVTEELSINLSEKSKTVNEDCQIVWKIIPSKDDRNVKYLRLLLINTNERKLNKDESKITATPSEKYLYQVELKIKSPGIVSYTEPHKSAINDEEYDINEVLYSDELVYGKGVNCAVTWEDSVSPTWVKTTSSPRKFVRAFSTSSDDNSVNTACRIFDMTIWSNIPKQEVLSRLKTMADAYGKWHQEQIAKANTNADVLKNVIDNQEAFLERLYDNIQYLEHNENAYKCFIIANTAMYIQMILSRDSHFTPKGKEPSTFDPRSTFFNKDCWAYFSENRTDINPHYRPFQLVFLLMNVKSTFEKNDKYRNEFVDLIWFPTGGGKTEAYLALTALTIAERRQNNQRNTSGVSVIMRYTLRLLTAQQFERASFLICALDYLRKELLARKEFDYYLGNSDQEISIGLWIGKASTPNKIKELKLDNKFKRFYDTLKGNPRKNIAPEIPQRNPFPVGCCPWCGCNLVGSVPPRNMILHGYQDNGNLKCINRNCSYVQHLPLYYIDEMLYNNPPTLLFATVDKFAQLTKKEAGKLFGIGIDRRKPDLIIQDELHLISGPLGSIVGLFETMIEELATTYADDGSVVCKPKIIGSTATTRNTASLIHQLYNRSVATFPVSGIRYSDNFFSHIVPQDESKRLYVGYSATGHTASELEIRVVASEMLAKEKLIQTYLEELNIDLNDKVAVANAVVNNNKLVKELDNYWSIVLYYKDLKSLGRTHSRIGQEIYANALSMRNFSANYPSLEFVLNDFPHRSTEFTSRQDSSRIKQLLIAAESRTKLDVEDNSSIFVKSDMDIIQATNMISVGIDIARWNVMVMVGQPMTTAEYIQSSSRVGRTVDGLIINVFNPMRTRELSHYENYEAYHQVFYKYVEPLSVTSFTDMTIEKLLPNIYIAYMLLKCKHDRQIHVTEEDVNSLKGLLVKRSASMNTYPGFNKYLNDSIDEIVNFFNDADRINVDYWNIILNDKDFAKEFPVMGSLRDVESNTYIKL